MNILNPPSRWKISAWSPEKDGLSWTLDEDFDNTELEEILFASKHKSVGRGAGLRLHSPEVGEVWVAIALLWEE